ncbi:fused response regulator/phosphatase, partial [Candidatus Kapabacteria bacterium]|nr:fused response regulator/phosphatase [Candidatus Kapabacteria bacterium]
KYDVHAASSAEEAIKVLEKKSNFAVVISDHDMPGMNGIDFLNIVKSKYPDIVRILMTAFGDMEIVIDAVNESNIFRFLVKSLDLAKFDRAITDAIDLYRIYTSEKYLKKKLEDTNKKLEQDLRAAAKLQQDIQPAPSSISGYSFNSLYMPSEFLSGDNFNYFVLDNLIVFYVLDVTGSGIPASMLSFTISKMLNSDKIPTNPLLEQTDSKYFPKSPSNALKQLNKTFLTRDEDLQFFTITLGQINIETGKVKISNGGNRRPIYQSANSTDFLKIKGLPIGALDDSTFMEKEFTLNRKDKLIVYTDGLCELRNDKDQMYSEDRMLEKISEKSVLDGASLMIDLKNEAIEWQGKNSHSDDITILCIEKV